MTRALIIGFAIIAASCSTLSGPGAEPLHGNWRGPTAYVVAYQSKLYIEMDTSGAETDGAIALGLTGVFQARGFWSPRATSDRPDRSAEFRRVQVSGRLQDDRGPLLLRVTDSISGTRYVDELLEWEQPPPPPPPGLP